MDENSGTGWCQRWNVVRYAPAGGLVCDQIGTTGSTRLVAFWQVAPSVLRGIVPQSVQQILGVTTP